VKAQIKHFSAGEFEYAVTLDKPGSALSATEHCLEYFESTEALSPQNLSYCKNYMTMRQVAVVTSLAPSERT